MPRWRRESRYTRRGGGGSPVSLFEPTPLPDQEPQKRPLAERMRPKTMDEFVGQEHILGPGKPLRRQIERDELSSLILWGPPGGGKTTRAQHRHLRRRDPPFQQGAAGCLPALRRARRYYPDRRHHREPFVRSHLRAA